MIGGLRIQRRLGWVAILAAVLALLLVARYDSSGVETDTERIQRLSESHACPVCDGQSVAESNAEAAVTIRQEIRQDVQGGSTDKQIRDRLVTQYGTEVLLNPPASGVATLVWVVPVIVVVVGAVGVALAVGRNTESRTATKEDRQLVAAARQARSGEGKNERVVADEPEIEKETNENNFDEEE